MARLFPDPTSRTGAAKLLNPILYLQRVQVRGAGASVCLDEVKDRISGNLARFRVDFERSSSWRAMHAVSLGHLDSLRCGSG